MSELESTDYAFPLASGPSNAPRKGMSLRDYFAAAALKGILANLHCTPQVTYEELAIRAYEQADAMLTVRQRKIK